MSDWITLTAFAIAAMGAAATGAAFPPSQWYRSLNKPRWTPPDWAFPLVWLVLYIAMVVSVWRVALTAEPLAAMGVALWSAQIVMNGLWTPVFFGVQKIRPALFVLTVLWLLVAATGLTFYLIDVVSGILFIPYLLWVSIAWALNAWIVRHNPGI